MSDFNLVSLKSAKDDSKVIKVKRLNTEITLNEKDVRVGSDAVLLDFLSYGIAVLQNQAACGI